MKIALLGAESTGKSELALALANALNQRQLQACAVPEYLRQWCEQHARTPRIDEQLQIALEQRDRIEAACAVTPWVIADTTPLMTAVYSEFVFADTSLYDWAIAYQRSFDLTLLTGLDVPWVADGIQRDGAQVRFPVDALLRQRLLAASIEFKVIYGRDQHRLDNVLKAVASIDGTASQVSSSPGITPNASSRPPSESPQAWVWNCDQCSNADCEHRLFTRLR